MIGIRSRTAVSKSMPVKPIAASPQTLMQSLSGLRELGAHRKPEAVAELGGLAPAEIGEGLDRLPERRELVARAAGIMGDDGVLDVDGVLQVPEHAVGIERRVVGGELRHPFRQPLLVRGRDLGRDRAGIAIGR